MPKGRADRVGTEIVVTLESACFDRWPRDDSMIISAVLCVRRHGITMSHVSATASTPETRTGVSILFFRIFEQVNNFLTNVIIGCCKLSFCQLDIT